MRWRAATAAAIHTNQIIVNEKSLRGIMLSTGSLFIFPPSSMEIYMEEQSVFFEFWYSGSVAWLLIKGQIMHCIGQDGPQTGPAQQCKVCKKALIQVNDACSTKH